MDEYMIYQELTALKTHKKKYSNGQTLPLVVRTTYRLQQGGWKGLEK